mmetsp:Transcript_7361/g.11181  ORF Transcript_7361/g.11181 Transcript_7361/m.11181 type:complete len:206 (-) Transcript_7361:76-693(-)
MNLSFLRNAFLLLALPSVIHASLRGSKGKAKEDRLLSSAGTFVSRHLIRAAAASTDLVYRRSLIDRPVKSRKVKKMLASGEDCLFGQRQRIGDCFGNILVDQNVLYDDFMTKAFMSSKSTISGILQYEARPREEMSAVTQNNFIEKKKADEIVSKLGLFAENSDNQFDFKSKTIKYLKREQEALHLEDETLDGIRVFLSIADLSE